MKICTRCSIKKSLNDFYKNGKNLHSYCKDCINAASLQRQRETKKKSVEYKGGKCVKCNYNKSIAALQFHHRDPTKKDPNWRMFKTRTFDKRMKEELDKCDLLCANCHAEIHSSVA